jgi:glycosyltransferase involved in cell wall biosynthesis
VLRQRVSGALRRSPRLHDTISAAYRGLGLRYAFASVRAILTIALTLWANLSRPWWRYAQLFSKRLPALSVPTMGQPKLIVMLAISEVWRDPRVERSARALAGAGYYVKIIYPDFFSKTLNIGPLDWGPNIAFRPLPRRAMDYAVQFPWVFGDALLKAATEERPFAFHCHDLSTAIVGLAAAQRVGARCVCDFHEWYSENVSWSAWRKAYVPHPALKRRLFMEFEACVMRHATALVTVCESIGAELSARHPNSRVPITIVRNIPPLIPECERDSRLRRQLGITPEQLLVLYQGGVGPSRMIEPIIEALRFAPRAVLIIRGPGIEIYSDAYTEIAAQHGVADRLYCLPPVPSADVVRAATEADIGMYTVPNLCKNFYYALPNKIFEYLAAGLPFLGPHFPEVQRIVDAYDIGLLFDPYDPRSIAAAINRLADEPETLLRMRGNIAAALADMDADREWQKLVTLYDELARPALATTGT